MKSADSGSWGLGGGGGGERDRGGQDTQAGLTQGPTKLPDTGFLILTQWVEVLLSPKLHGHSAGQHASVSESPRYWELHGE